MDIIYNLLEGAQLPSYESEQAAGADIRAYLKQEEIIRPGERKLIPTGLFIGLPEGCEVQIRPRSGLALKHGVTVLNAPGTIDSDYRGEIGVILINLGDKDFTIKNGDRIAQMVVSKHERGEFINRWLDKTNRGSGGFGHTGI